MAPHGSFWWTARTPWEHAQLPAVVARLKGQYNTNPFKDEKNDWLVMQDVEYGPKIREGGFGEDKFSLQREGQYGMAQQRILRTLNGLERAIESLDGFEGHKSVVIYSEGFLLSPRLVILGDYYQHIVDQCRRANVALFVADPGGLRTGRPTAESPTGGGSVGPTGGLLDAERAGSTHIALATGGRGFFANDATEAVASVLEESRAYYLVGFRPAEGRPGFRKLDVRVRREGLRVRARNRYYWGEPLPRETEDPAAVVALRAVSDRTDVSFELTAVPRAAIGAGPAPVRLELRLGPVAERERRLKLLVEARPLAGGEPVRDGADLTVPTSATPQTVVRELRLAPGVWQARVVLTEPETSGIGSVLHTFEVPAATVTRLER